ncbi:hypothetical protein J27TS8_36810 [Robertmurraya siralis]|uniref:Multi-TM2 domain-containing protein n=1 Tax=Robertmurraya siralis TaxID=77777 RepID=A0A919WKE4_9BACI|nr:hypothetical protein [Robertmurraya siralis]PAE21313.1 hypothetical protein CHH80_07560 [Bacillus sp. 7504-2]GIN63688.1 hypothetical protein J27TS8_36810 [Robertmurraya siralis]
MKNPILAFLLSFFPGGGLLYLRQTVRGLAYMFGEFALILLFIVLMSALEEGLAIIIFILGVILYIVNIIDTAITAPKTVYKAGFMQTEGQQPSKVQTNEQERFFTIVLSFIPGVGHFQLGLMNRGMTLLTAFLGTIIMVIFVTVLSSRMEFLLFLALLPVIWVYGFFDTMQQLNKKQLGEELVDRSILEDLEMKREVGKKSKSIATFLSIFPGAGHLYLGLQKRGIQLMAAFLFSIYILDVLRLGIFLFLIPIIWFYSFFDGLQKASRYGREELEDVPIISHFINHQKWVGIGLVLLGLYYLTSNIVLPAFSPMISELINIDVRYWFDRYFQTGIVCVLMIGGGIKLLMGSKRKKEGKAE